MGLEELRLKIERETESEAARIEEEGKAEYRRILEKTKAEMAKAKAAFNEETALVLAAIEKKSHTDAQFEAKRQLLLRKKEMLDEVYEAAKQQAGAKSTKARLEKLLAKAKTQIKVGSVLVNKRDLKSIVGVPASEAPLSGGLIAESPDGSTRVDLSFDSLLEQAWTDHVQDVVKTLFT